MQVEVVARQMQGQGHRDDPINRESFIERRAAIFVFVILWLLALAAVWDCSHRPLFYDELFTYYVVRLDSLGSVWKALRSGADNHAPLDYLILHLTMRLFGESELTLRAPSAIAYLLGLAGLFRFVRNAFGASQGLMAVMAGVMCYHEMLLCARPYGILVGICAGLLVCWQNAAVGRHRFASLTGIALLCVLAPLLHYYGFLLVLPIMGAEIRRSQLARRVDPVMWLCFAFVIAPLPILWPFIVSARAYSQGFWTKALTGNANLFLVYLFLLWRIVICLLMTSITWLFLRIAVGRQKKTPRLGRATPEFVAGIVLISSPIIVYIIAITITNASSTIYSLQAGFGAGIVLAAWAKTKPVLKLSLGLSLGICMVAILWDISSCTDPLYFPPTMRYLAAHLFSMETSVPPSIQGSQKLADYLITISGEKKLPVVFACPTQYMRDVYYGGSAGTEFIYLSDRKIALSVLKFDTVDRGLSQLSPFAHLRVLNYREFIRTQRQFLVVLLPPSNREERIVTWLPTELQLDHARFTYFDPNDPELAEVTMK